MNCIEVCSPCPTIQPPPARPRMAVLPEVPCSRVSSVAKGSPSSQMCHLHSTAIPLDLSRAILPCFFLAHFTVSDSLTRTARQIERQTPTATFPSPSPSLSARIVLCAQLVPSRARFSSLWLPSTTTRDEPIIFQIKWAACATGCFYYIPPSINN